MERKLTNLEMEMLQLLDLIHRGFQDGWVAPKLGAYTEYMFLMSRIQAMLIQTHGDSTASAMMNRDDK